jgi:hypothetical protein
MREDVTIRGGVRELGGDSLTSQGPVSKSLPELMIERASRYLNIQLIKRHV